MPSAASWATRRSLAVNASSPVCRTFPRPCPRSGDFFVRALGQPECAHAAREVDALPEPLACLDPLVRAAEGCAEIDEGVRVLEPELPSPRAPRPPRGAMRFPPCRLRPRRARGARCRLHEDHPNVERARAPSLTSTRASSARSSSRRPSAAQLRQGTVLGLSKGTSRTVSPTWSSSSTPARGYRSRCADARDRAETR